MTEQTQDGADVYEHHGSFPQWTAVEPVPAFGEFVGAMRDLQDLAVSADAPDEVIAEANKRTRELVDLLAPYRVAEGYAPAGRVMSLPGRGNLMILPWTIKKMDADGVAMSGTFRRFHLGGNNAAHGGVLPLLFDDVFGLLVQGAGVGISRTAFLHINYRSIAPIETKLFVEGKIDRREGRKSFVSARLTAKDGTLIADCEALMIQLRRDQP